MNILFINSAKTWGGNELWSTSAANALAEAGHNVYFAFRQNIFSARLSSKVNTVYIPLKNELDFSSYKSLYKLIKNEKIDVILPTKRKEYFIAGVIGKIMRVAVCFRLGIVREISKLDIFQRFVYKRLPDAIIVNAEKIKKVLLESKICDEEKIAVIYNGYKFPDFTPSQDFEIEKSDFTFAAAGRLSAQKGFDILLKAAKIVSKTINFKIYIAGDGSDRVVYEKYILDNRLEGKIVLLGHISNVRDLFNKADCILIPSRNEGIPNALFEAWSLKKPVIASNSAGIPEAINDNVNGLLCELNEIDLSEKMKYVVVNKSKIQDLGDKGYETLIESFSLGKMLNSLELLLRSVIAKTRK